MSAKFYVRETKQKKQSYFIQNEKSVSEAVHFSKLKSFNGKTQNLKVPSQPNAHKK
jgi:hypothetical protein